MIYSGEQDQPAEMQQADVGILLVNNGYPPVICYIAIENSPFVIYSGFSHE
jgi:hypothetical protein